MITPKFLRRLGLLATLSLSYLGFYSVPTSAQAQNFAMGQSGQYGPMTVGISGSGNRITGYYEGYSGWDDNLNAPRFSCIFHFSGDRDGSRYRITSWSPEQEQNVIVGSLSFLTQNNGSKLLLQLKEDHGGCWNVQSFDGAGSSLSLHRRGHWTSVRVVANQRAYFHRQPNEATPQKSYVIAGDVLKIYETRGGWVDAEFGTNRTTRGWIKLSDLQSDS